MRECPATLEEKVSSRNEVVRAGQVVGCVCDGRRKAQGAGFALAETEHATLEALPSVGLEYTSALQVADPWANGALGEAAERGELSTVVADPPPAVLEAGVWRGAIETNVVQALQDLHDLLVICVSELEPIHPASMTRDDRELNQRDGRPSQ
jgi:hypothetical protein